MFDSAARQVVYVKGRRAGGTHGAVLRLVELAVERPGSRHLWVDLVQRHIARYVRRYFGPALHGLPWHWDEAALSLSLPNGSHCDFGSAQYPERLEGMAYDFIWINEAGHLLRNESLYYETLLPMAMESPRAQVFLIGTPKGRGLFERMYDRGQEPQQTEWQSFRHPSHVNPRVDPKWLAHLKTVLPERTWTQEIMAEFVDDAGSVFRGVADIANATPEPQPHPDAEYVIGVDLGRYQDYTAAWVLRRDSGAGIYCDRYNKVSWPVQLARLLALVRRYGNAPLYVDSTGVGDPLCDALDAEGLDVTRVSLSAQSKRQLVERLAIGIESAALRIVPHEQTVRELNAFRYEITATGHLRTGGLREHDDCVIALALAWRGVEDHRLLYGAGSFFFGKPWESAEFD